MSADPTTYALAFLATDGLLPLEVMGSNEYSYCCNEDNKTCCPLMPVPDAISEDLLDRLQDRYEVAIGEPSQRPMFPNPLEADVAWRGAPYCCNAATDDYTCCAPVTGGRGAEGPGAWRRADETAGQLAATPSGVVRAWFDGDRRARAVCLN